MGGYTPYGYRYVARNRESGKRATLEVDEAQAAVVRDMFRWLLEEGLSCRGIARRLTELGVQTSRGKVRWNPSAVNRMLKQEVYRGTFYYHRGEPVEPSRHVRQDPYRKHRLTGRKLRPREEWIAVPVPAIVDGDTWEAAQRQLRVNFVRSPRHNVRYHYLLRGLIRCPKCGASCVGTFSHGRRHYHCSRNDPLATASGTRCGAGWVPAEPLEDAVWQAVVGALQQPQVLADEYRRRMAKADVPDAIESERKQGEIALQRLKAQQDRMTDAYMNEALELPDYKAQMEKLREHRQQVERRLAELEHRAESQVRGEDALERLETFCETMARGLGDLTFEEKQALLALVVERIVVEAEKVRVEAIIPVDNEPANMPALRPQCEHAGPTGAIS